MFLAYPRDVVWYIEARNDAPGSHASADPYSRGSGVVVELETLDAQGQPLVPPQLRKYLLTCAHVVREDNWGAAYTEILCWKPGKGYLRTGMNQRLIGEPRGAYLARIAALSPCNGAQAMPGADQQDYNDWVLLDIDAPRFQAESAIRAWSQVNAQAMLHIVGFPGGAGVEADRHTAIPHYWNDGDLVENTDSARFQQQRSRNAGLLALDGAAPVGPGMSGGGVFDDDGRLVGLHRGSNAQALMRVGVDAAHILNWLRTHRYQRPALALPGTPAAALGAPAAAPDPGVIREVLLGNQPPIVFINRNKLRGNLEQLAAPGSRWRVVTLNGDSGSGKTWSWGLIGHTARHLGVRSAFVDLSQQPDVASACESAARQLRLDRNSLRSDVLADTPTPDRMGQKFANWLVDATNARSPQMHWLVIDGLHAGNRPRDELDSALLGHLLRELRQSPHDAGQLVLFLLGRHETANSLLRNFVLDEQVELIRRDEIGRFVRAAILQRYNRLLRDAEVDDIVQQIAGNAAGPYDAAQMALINDRAIQLVQGLAP